MREVGEKQTAPLAQPVRARLPWSTRSARAPSGLAGGMDERRISERRRSLDEGIALLESEQASGVLKEILDFMKRQSVEENEKHKAVLDRMDKLEASRVVHARFARVRSPFRCRQSHWTCFVLS